MAPMKGFLPALLLLLTSCSNQAQPVGELPPDAYGKAIGAAGIQLLDVRTAGEYRSGHLKGALQADWRDSAQFADRTQHLDRNRPVYVYCLSGGRSAAAAQYLRAKGFREVTNLSGGISAWKTAGMPVEAEDPQKAQTPRATYDALAASAPVVIVDFGAEWCPPCRKMEPVLKSYMEGKSEQKIRLVKMDGGSETELMKEMKVTALPTFILYRNGVEDKRLQGVMTGPELEKWVFLKD
ncbi:MAG: thioredoxin [Chitinophagia bacterium]|nr:thioredoxin [Chitinophagia bacterium]